MGFFRQEHWRIISFSKGSSWPRDQAHICVSCIAGEFFTCWSISKAQPEFKSPLFGRLWEQDFSLVEQDITDKQREEARMNHGTFSKNYRFQCELMISLTDIDSYIYEYLYLCICKQAHIQTYILLCSVSCKSLKSTIPQSQRSFLIPSSWFLLLLSQWKGSGHPGEVNDSIIETGNIQAELEHLLVP